MASASFGTEVLRVVKRVYYEDSSVLYAGMPLCYNFNTTSNILGVDPYSLLTTGEDTHVTASTTTTEGYQNEGKFLRVENPSDDNSMFFAGVFVEGSQEAGKTSGPCWLSIYVANGAMVPVRSMASSTVGMTVLCLASGSQALRAYTDGGSYLPVAVAMETVDRSGTNGLCLAKLIGSAGVFTGMNAVFVPTRGLTTGTAAGIRINLDYLYTGAGTGGPRTYGLYITGSKESGAITVGGADDAAIRVSVTNYVVNAEIFNFRGLNVRVANRDGGVVGELSNTITAFVDGTGTLTGSVRALMLEAYQESADNPDELGVLDCCVCREGGAATTEYGIQIRTRGTINTAVNTAIRLTKDATDHGFINLLNIETDAIDVLAATGDTAHDTSDICLPIVFNGATYYIVAQDSRG